MTYKNAKIILFASLLVAMILPFSGMNYAEAEEANNVNEQKQIKLGNSIKLTGSINIADYQTSGKLIPLPLENDPKMFEELIKQYPMPTDDERNKQAQIHATNDPKVKNLLGNGFKYQSTAYSFDGIEWQPIINFKTKNGDYMVTVTMDGDKVKKIQKSKAIKLTNQPAGFGIRGISQSYSMSGNLMALNAPDYTHTGNVTGQANWVALLLNSMKAGSTNDLCVSANMPNSYWAQIGLVFSDKGTKLVYTDTGFNCWAQPLSMPINTNDRIHFYTTIDDATDEWTLYAINYSMSPPMAYGFYRILPNSDLIANNSVVGTNVFFENQNSASTAWSLGFANDVLVDYAGFKYPPTGGWYYWAGDMFGDAGCHPGPIVPNVDLLTGSFTSSTHDVTWDVSEMDTLCGQN